MARASLALLTIAAAARASSTRSTVKGRLISAIAAKGIISSRLSRCVMRSLPSIVGLVLRACPHATPDVHEFLDGQQVARVYGRHLNRDGRHVEWVLAEGRVQRRLRPLPSTRRDRPPQQHQAEQETTGRYREPSGPLVRQILLTAGQHAVELVEYRGGQGNRSGTD